MRPLLPPLNSVKSNLNNESFGEEQLVISPYEFFSMILNPLILINNVIQPIEIVLLQK